MCIGEIFLLYVNHVFLSLKSISTQSTVQISLQALGWEQQLCLREAMQSMSSATPVRSSPTTSCQKMLYRALAATLVSVSFPSGARRARFNALESFRFEMLESGG